MYIKKAVKITSEIMQVNETQFVFFKIKSMEHNPGRGRFSIAKS